MALLKADTSTRWWTENVWTCATFVGFFRKRLEYTDATGLTKRGKANFPSALVLYGLDPFHYPEVKWVKLP